MSYNDPRPWHFRKKLPRIGETRERRFVIDDVGWMTLVLDRRRAGDPAVLVASSEKIRRVLGWEPQHSDIESIIRSAWEWHKRQAVSQ